MDVVFDLAGWPRPGGGTVVTIGVYDGVHRGHRAVIGHVIDRARSLGVPSAVVTFDPHPAAVVRPDSAPQLLTDLDQRLDVLESIGVDIVVVVAFDKEQSQEEPEDFVKEVLVDGLGARVVVVGDDFHFGRARRGNVALLRNTGSFEVVKVDALTGAGTTEMISSTTIRELVSAGSMGEAADLLGRLYEIRGMVVGGDRRGGQELGFPTANLEVPPDILLPCVGIYAGCYERPDGSVHPAAISVGQRPTFHSDSAPVVVEAYLLDFEGDLYGEAAQVRFVARLRGEEKFSSAEALVAQIHADVAATRAALSGPS